MIFLRRSTKRFIYFTPTGGLVSRPVSDSISDQKDAKELTIDQGGEDMNKRMQHELGENGEEIKKKEQTEDSGIVEEETSSSNDNSASL